jgi:hypothetical protein
MPTCSENPRLRINDVVFADGAAQRFEGCRPTNRLVLTIRRAPLFERRQASRRRHRGDAHDPEAGSSPMLLLFVSESDREFFFARPSNFLLIGRRCPACGDTRATAQGVWLESTRKSRQHAPFDGLRFRVHTRSASGRSQRRKETGKDANYRSFLLAANAGIPAPRLALMC